MIFVFLVFIVIFKSSVCVTCDIPNNYIISTQNYINYLNLGETISCEGNRIIFSPEFSIFYDDNPDEYDENQNYGIVSRSFSTICQLNVYYANLKTIQLIQTLDYLLFHNYRHFIIYSDTLKGFQYNEIYPAIYYHDGDILLVTDKFNSTELKDILNEYSDMSDMVILNFLINEIQSSNLFRFYQDNYDDYKDIYVLSYYIEESYSKVDAELVKHTHIVSGYFYSVDTEENREFQSRFNLRENEYLNDLYFQIAILLEFYKLIPVDFPSSNPFLNRRQLKDKEIELAGIVVKISPLNTFDRTMFLADIDGDGNITNILNLKTDNPFYNERYIASLVCDFVERFDVINIAILTPMNGNKIIYSFAHAVYAAVYELNKHKTLDAYLLLTYSYCNKCTLKESYDYLKEIKPKFLFHFSLDDDLFEVFQLIKDDKENAPYILVDGFYTRSICNPKLIYFGLSLQEQVFYYNYQFVYESTLVFISNSTYGNNAFSLLENIFKTQESSSYIRISLDENEYKQRVDEAVKNLIIKPNTVVYVIAGNCEYIRIFVEDWNNRHLSNKVSIFNLDQYCFKEYSKWEGFYTISKFLVPYYRNTTIYEFQYIDNNGFINGISPFSYSVYYGALLLNRAIKTAGSIIDNTFTTTISLINAKYENIDLKFTSNNAIASVLQEAKSVGKGGWEFVSKSLKTYSSSPITSTEIENGEVSQCNWIVQKQYNYTKKYPVYSILVLDSNYQLYDLVGSILDLIYRKGFDVFFTVRYLKLDENVDIDVIEEMIKGNHIKFILTTDDNVENLEHVSIPLISIAPYEEIKCFGRVYNFGYSYSSVLTVSISIPYQLGITNYIIIKDDKTRANNSFEAYLIVLLDELLGESNYKLLIYSVDERNAISNIITSITKPTFLYLQMVFEKDIEFTRYLIEDLNYNNQLLHVFHFNNRIPIYNREYSNLKNNYFVSNHPFSDNEIGRKLFKLMLETKFDSYSLYTAIYYVTYTINYCYKQYITNYESYLSTVSYIIFEEEAETRIYNHNLYTPLIIAHVIDNDNMIVSKSPTSYIPISSVDAQLSIHSGGNEAYYCSMEEDKGKYYPVDIIRIGFILDSPEFLSKYLKDMKISIKIFVDYFNSVMTQFALKVITVHFDINNSNVEDVIQLFKENNITHIFGGLHYNVLMKFIPYLEENGMLFWYSSSVINVDFCDKNVIPFIVQVSSLNLIQMESELLLFVYSTSTFYFTSVQSISAIFKDSNNEVLEFVLDETYNEENIDKVIDEIILSMNRQCYIVMLLKSNDFNYFVPRFRNIASSLKNIPHYYMFTISDYALMKNSDTIFDDIYFLSGVDNLFFPELKDEIINIFTTYNLKDKHPTTAEYFIYLSLYYFVKSIQKVGYRSVYFIKYEIQKLILRTDTANMLYSLPSICYRDSYNSISTLYYLNTTYFSLTEELKFYKSPYLCIVDEINNIYGIIKDNSSSSYSNNDSKSSKSSIIKVDDSITPTETTYIPFHVGLLLERGSLDYDDRLFYMSVINAFNYFMPNMIGGNKKMVLKSYFISDSSKIDSFYAEIKENVNSIDLFIGIIRNDFKDIILPLLEEYKKVMYYLYDDSGFNCSPYVFYMGLSTISKIYPTVHFIKDECELSSILYPLSYFGKKEYDAVMDELKKYHITILTSYGLDEQSNLTLMLPSLYRNIEGGCILNFLNDYNTVKLINAMNKLGIISQYPVISFSLSFSLLELPPLNVTHKIVTYFNPINYHSPYSDISQMFKNTYAITLRLHRVYYNMINAIYLLKEVLGRTTNGTVEDFIVGHNNIQLKSNDYILTMSQSHYFNHPKYVFLHKPNPDYDQQLSFNNDNNNQKFQLTLLFQSPKGYTPHVYSHSDPHICLFTKNGFYVYFIPKKVVRIGLLYSFNGEREVIERSSYTTAYGSFHEVIEDLDEYDDSIGMYRRILLDAYNLESNETKCYDAMKYFQQNNATYVVTFGTISCMKEISKGTKESNVIYFITKDICESYCNAKYVITGRYPNQIIRPVVSYFSGYLQTHSLSYVIYDSRMEDLNNYANYLKRSPMNVEYYDLSTVADFMERTSSFYSREIMAIVKRIYDSPGLIISLLHINELKSVLYSYHRLLMSKEKYPFVILMNSLSQLRDSIPSSLLSDIYIPSSTSSFDPSNNYFMDNNRIRFYDSNTYIAFYIISKLINNNINVADLYGKKFTSNSVGSFQMTYANAVALPFKFILLESNVERFIYKSDYLYLPDPYHTSADERNKICVIDDLFGEIIINTTQKYLVIGIYVEEDSDYSIYLFATQIIDTVSALIVDYNKWKVDVLILNSENEIVDFINMYKEKDKYEVCFLVNSLQYSTLLLDTMDNSNKTVFTTVYRGDYCKSNIISMDSYSFSSLLNVVQQFMVIYSGCRFAFYYNDEYEVHYKKLEEVISTIEFTVLASLPISSDPKVLKASFDIVGYSMYPVVIFVDVDDEDVDRIEDGVTNMFTHYIFQIYFFQWFKNSRSFIDRPYYYYYGSMHSMNIDQNSKIFSLLYPAENIESYNPYTMTKYFDLLKLFYVWKSAFKENQSGSLLNLYNKAIETEFGDLILFPNNRIGSKMILAYHSDSYYYECTLSHFVNWMMIFTDPYSYKTKLPVCDWNDEISREKDGIRYKIPLVVSLLIDNSTNQIHLSHQMAVFLYRLFGYSSYYDFGLFHDYVILVYIENVNKDTNITSLIKRLYSRPNLVAVFDLTEIGMEQYQDLICSKDVFYFMMPLVSQYYTCRNMYDIGLSSLAISKHIYQDVVDIVDTFIVLHDSDIDLGSNILKYLKLLSFGTIIKFIDIKMDDVYSKMVGTLQYCKGISTLYSSCVMIISNLQRTSYIIYSYFYEQNIDFRKDMSLYILHDDVYVSDYYRKYIDGAFFLSTYVITITDPSFSKYTKTTQEFYDFISSEFGDSLLPSSVLESVYTGFLVLKQLFSKIDHFDYDLMSKFLTNAYYDTPSGPAFFGKSRSLLRDIIISIISVNESFPQVDSTRALINPSYFFQQLESDENSIDVAIVIDVNNNTQLAAQVYASVFNELVTAQNQIGGLNNIPIILKVYSLDFSMNDTEVMNDLMENENISFIVGCITKYCHDLVSSYVTYSDKIFLSHADYPKHFCNRNVIMVTSLMIDKIVFTLSHLQKSNFSDIVLLAMEYTNGKIIEKYIKKHKMNLLDVYLVPEENYDSTIQYILDDLGKYNSSSKIVIMNLLIDDYLVAFEKEYIKRKFLPMHIFQVLLSYEDYVLHEDTVSQLSGNCVVRQFDEDSKNDLSVLFIKMMNSKYGVIHKSQGMALYDVSLRLILNAYKSALIMMESDDLEPVYNNIDYLRRAIQTSSFDSSCGIVSATDSNELLYKFHISQFSIAGRLLYISSNMTGNAEDYFIKPTNCNFGPKITYYNVAQPVRVIVLTFSVLSMVMIVIVNIFLVLYHKRIRESSPYFLVYFSFSGIVTVIAIIIQNEIRYSSVMCKFITSLIFILLINDLAILVFRTWRIHAIYNNSKMTKYRINAKTIIRRILLVVFLDIIISIIWGVVGDFSYYREDKLIDKSTNIEYVVIKTCKSTIEYLIIQGIILIVLLSFGIYYCWSTRNLSSDFNDSVPLGVSIGLVSFLLVIVFLLDVSLQYELYPQYIIQIGGGSTLLLVILLLFSVPRFYKIFYLDNLPPEDKYGTGSGVEAVNSVNAMMVGYAPDYSMATMTNTNKQSRRTHNNKSLMTLSTYTTPTRNKVDVPYGKCASINKRLNNVIQGNYTKRKGLEIITDKSDGDKENDEEIQRNNDKRDENESDEDDMDVSHVTKHLFYDA